MCPWNERCDTLHGATKEENRKIKKQKSVQKVAAVYRNREAATGDLKYTFLEDKVKWCKRLTQYLKKWLADFQKAMRKKPREVKNTVTDKPSRNRAHRGMKGKWIYCLGR